MDKLEQRIRDAMLKRKLLGAYKVPSNMTPKTGCKHCYGRGWVGKDEIGRLHLCSCLRKG